MAADPSAPDPAAALDDWARIDALFEQALALPEGEQSAWLEAKCGDDAGLRRRLESLLQADRQVRGVLDLSTTLDGDKGRGSPSGPSPPQELGPYKVLQVLGEGGSSTVYLGERRDTYRQKVAIKILRIAGSGSDIAARFLRERQILAGLDHPLIAKILDGGETPEGSPYLVMEYVDGTPIDEYCFEHQLETRAIVELFLRLLDAVEHSHRNLVVHRDIKPGNVLVRGDGAPRLVDFGIAKLLNAELMGNLDPTRHDVMLLTPSYASPEQFSGQAISTSSDIYSLGVLLYKLLTGDLPYDASTESVHALATAICDTEPIRASRRARETLPERPERARELQGDLDQILSVALAKRPVQRYRSVDRFADDLKRYLDGMPVSAQPASLWYRSRKFIRRNRLAVSLAALIVVLLGVSAGNFVIQSARTQKALVEAETERSTAEAVKDFLRQIFVSADPLQGQGKEVTVLDAIRTAEDQIGESFAGQPLVEAEIRSIMGATYFQLGVYDAAERMHERAAELRRAAGTDPVDLASSLSDLTRVYRRQRRLEESEAVAKEAMSLLEGQESEHAAEVEAHLRMEIGTLLRNQWRLEEAERELLLARQAFLDRPSLAQGWEAAGTLQGLATVRGMQGRYPQAAEDLAQALKELVAVYGGEEHGALATVHHNLGFLSLLIGDYDRAIEMFRKAIEIANRRFGTENGPKTGMAHAGLGESLAAQGRYSEALGELEGALAIFEASMGQESALGADTLNAMAWAHLGLAELDRAGELADRALHIVAGLEEPDPEELANCHEVAADLAMARGDWQSAERWARQAYEEFIPLVGEEHHDTAVAAGRLGRILVELGRHQEAEALLEGAVQVLDRATLPPARKRIRVQLAWARCLVASQRAASARSVLEKLRSAWPDYAGEADPLTRELRAVEDLLGGSVGIS